MAGGTAGLALVKTVGGWVRPVARPVGRWNFQWQSCLAAARQLTPQNPQAPCACARWLANGRHLRTIHKHGSYHQAQPYPTIAAEPHNATPTKQQRKVKDTTCELYYRPPFQYPGIRYVCWKDQTTDRSRDRKVCTTCSTCNFQDISTICRSFQLAAFAGYIRHP